MPETAALQVTWIEAAAVSSVAPPNAEAPAPALPHSTQAVTPAAKPSTAIIDVPPTPETPSGKPLSVVLLGQARQWARQQAPLEFADTAAAAKHSITLPGQPANRFRMTPPLSPAEVVGLIGMAFGAGPHPCIRNRQNVAAYATGRDEKVLELELDFERRHCRP